MCGFASRALCSLARIYFFSPCSPLWAGGQLLGHLLVVFFACFSCDIVSFRPKLIVFYFMNDGTCDTACQISECLASVSPAGLLFPVRVALLRCAALRLCKGTI
jgi:hypothetical protein